MTEATWFGIGIAVLVLVAIPAAAIKIVPEYERGVVLRLGRVLGDPKGPGLIIIIPIVDRMIRVDLRTQTTDVPPQDVITEDNVTIHVDAVTYFQVIEPIRSVISIYDYRVATSKVAQTTLRSILGQRPLDDVLSKRDEINAQLQQAIDEVTDPWGVKVSLVEVKDVNLTESMRRVKSVCLTSLPRTTGPNHEMAPTGDRNRDGRREGRHRVDGSREGHDRSRPSSSPARTVQVRWGRLRLAPAGRDSIMGERRHASDGNGRYERGLDDYHDPTRGIGGAPPARSALTLRLWLAAFGFVICALITFLAAIEGIWWLSAVSAGFAVVAAVDFLWVRHRKRRGEPG